MLAGPRDAFIQLLIFDVVRGKDSTGVASIHKGGWNVDKATGVPHELLERQKAKNNIESLQNIALIGHNRSATVGSINRQNAHPFDFEHIVGVHNGTLRNKGELESHADFGTDSEALFYNLDKYSPKEVIPKVDGAYALVWYDKRDTTINFLRNSERPMFLAMSEDKKFLYWASEAGMLDFVLRRNNIKYDMTELPVDLHHAFVIPQGFNNSFGKPSVAQVKGKDRVVSSFNANNWKGHNNNNNVGQSSYPAPKQTGTKKIKTGDFTLTEKPVGRMVDLVYAYQGVNAFKEKFIAARVAGDAMNEYRLYYQKEEDVKLIKHVKNFRSMVSRVEAMQFSPSLRTEYYVISPHMVHIETSKNVHEIIKVPQEAELFEEETVKDHAGVEINREAFKLRYHQCEWCTDNVTFEEQFKPLDSTRCLCAVCASDKEVLELIPNCM